MSLFSVSSLYALATDLLDEDMVQRRPNELEALDRRAGLQQAAEQELWIGAGGQLDLERPVRVIEARDEPAVGEDRTHAVGGAAT